MQNPTKFDQFVRAYGVARLARELSLNDSAIYHWLAGSTRPRIDHADRILSLAKRRRFALSLAEIYQHSRDVRQRSLRTASLKSQPAHV